MASYTPGRGSWKHKVENDGGDDAQHPPAKRVKATVELSNDELFYYDSGAGTRSVGTITNPPLTPHVLASHGAPRSLPPPNDEVGSSREEFGTRPAAYMAQGRAFPAETSSLNFNIHSSVPSEPVEEITRIRYRAEQSDLTTDLRKRVRVIEDTSVGQDVDIDDLSHAAQDNPHVPPPGLNNPFAAPTAEFISLENFPAAEDQYIPSETSMDDRDLAPEPVVFSSRDGLKRKRGEDLPDIVAEWEPRPNQDPTPWLKEAVRSGSAASGLRRLHHEMLAFFDLVKPRLVDKLVRRRIATEIGDILHQSFTCLFGSSATGLFLPNADLDMVSLSKQFVETAGDWKPDENLFAVRDWLLRSRRADKNHVEVILWARVPIVKFVESSSRFSVDISFNNASGIVAVRKVLLEWLDRYPALPILVLILKQFLLMRKMDEPKDGWMGGLTITCLIVNFLKYHPLGHARPEFTDGAEQFHLGKLLLDFFDFYGNRFDMTSIGIDMEKGFFKKDMPEDKWMVLNWWDRQDMSGGTKKAPRIAAAFARARHDLQSTISNFDLMKANNYDQGATDKVSILGAILAGNYRPYQERRVHNDSLWPRLIAHEMTPERLARKREGEKRNCKSFTAYPRGRFEH